ncbi:hypothetical protein SAY87_011995 [Trapa incisa]|uniref:Origin recognition complex subunit 2 n=1 Tax=Trapa incisa TaxID=236973 RepID=A0AAN7GRL6_9MYRT|nr:hypothetical protein SAY87_011995 [Trapa incisa]
MEIDDFDMEEFGLSRNYFLAKESRSSSSKKSVNKLSDIEVLNEKELEAAVANIEPKHQKEISALKDSYKSSYSEWVFKLRCGFGLLFYGFGSKRALIEDFASTSLTEYSVVVVNGYLQSVNIKQVVACIAEVLWDSLNPRRKIPRENMSILQQPLSSQSMEDHFAFLDGSWTEENDCFVGVVIHNIDGPGLRDSETQQCLAQLAACSNVRIIASTDHVNSPLLWDKKMVNTQFNWYWLHTPTFEPYKIEGMSFPLILEHGNTNQSAKTATIVLQSLTTNAQSVFRVVAEHQLSHPDEEGIPISSLYTACRERFLVSSQVTLNSHLTEFKDHELVKIRKNSDGADCLYIPLPKEALEKLLSEIN